MKRKHTGGAAMLLQGAMLGAGAMYLLDPDRGARRRARLRDRSVHLRHRLGDGAVATARDVRNRSAGAAALARTELRARLRPEPVDDALLAQRARSALGRAVSTPHAVVVEAHDGVVTLRGPVLAGEAGGLLACVARVRGVREVVNALQPHEDPAHVSALQGARQRAARRAAERDAAGPRWSPAARLGLGLAGLAVAARGGARGGLAGMALRTAGLGLLTRAVTNVPGRRLVGVGAGRRAVELQKTITVAARIEDVWALWSNFENFPRFMRHLVAVRRLDDDRSRWTAAGPAHLPVEWDAVITRWEPERLIAWESLEGSPIATAGMVRFERVSNERTRVHVRLSYTPVAGAIGHTLASFLGVDPKHAMDEDLLRLQSLLEEGHTRGGDGGEVLRADVVHR